MNERKSAESAFDLLIHYAVRSRACALAAPELASSESSWTGIGFTLGEAYFLAMMDDIVEIINLPSCTSIPRTQHFVRGVANIRGAIVPVIDLMAFFSKDTSRVSRLRRLLVVEYKESYTGLVVDDILGMQHFSVDHYEPATRLPSDDCFTPYLNGSYWRMNQAQDTKEYWPVFELDKLLLDARLENLSA